MGWPWLSGIAYSIYSCLNLFRGAVSYFGKLNIPQPFPFPSSEESFSGPSLLDLSSDRPTIYLLGSQWQIPRVYIVLAALQTQAREHPKAIFPKTGRQCCYPSQSSLTESIWNRLMHFYIYIFKYIWVSWVEVVISGAHSAWAVLLHRMYWAEQRGQGVTPKALHSRFLISFSRLCQLNCTSVLGIPRWCITSADELGLEGLYIKASLIKWLLSNKNLVLPIKHTQVRVLILLTLCLHYALEEAAWPFCLIQAHFANTNKMLCLVECWCPDEAFP